MLDKKSQSTIHSKDFVDSCLTYNGMLDIRIKRQNIECPLYFVNSFWTYNYNRQSTIHSKYFHVGYKDEKTKF